MEVIGVDPKNIQEKAIKLDIEAFLKVDPKNIQEKAIKLYIEEYMKLSLNSLKDQNMIDMGEKIEGQVKVILEMKLKKLLKLPDVAVIKILDFLLYQSVSDNDAEVVKFEERDDNDRVGRILLKVYDFFCKVVNRISEALEVYGCKCCIILFVTMDVITLMDDEDGNDWKEYFGIEEETVEDIWEDDEMAHSFRELFVGQIA